MQLPVWGCCCRQGCLGVRLLSMVCSCLWLGLCVWVLCVRLLWCAGPAVVCWACFGAVQVGLRRMCCCCQSPHPCCCQSFRPVRPTTRASTDSLRGDYAPEGNQCRLVGISLSCRRTVSDAKSLSFDDGLLLPKRFRSARQGKRKSPGG